MNNGFKFRTLNLGCHTKFNIHELDFTSAEFILVVLWYVLLYSFVISTNLSIYALILQSYIYNFLKILINLSAATNFVLNFFIMRWINVYISILKQWFHWFILKFTNLICYLTILPGLWPDSYMIFMNLNYCNTSFYLSKEQPIHIYYKYQ